ncbi:MAG: hypothetical protein WD602_07675 [Actinomycetota bacterium]
MTLQRSALRRAGTGLAILLALSQCSSPTPADISSPSASASIGDARWEGTWEFTYTLTEIEGVSDQESQFEVGSTIRRIWNLAPQCDTGPCNLEITATDPDDPLAPEVESSAIYDSGVYRVTQAFAPVPEDVCRTDDGEIIPSAFTATNAVEVVPTEFEVRDGSPVVTEATSSKRTSFVPIDAVAGRGGTCVTKTATWEGKVVPISD